MRFTELVATTPPPPNPTDAKIALLEHRLASLEKVVLAGAEDRHLTVEEFAARIRHSPKTVRNWLVDAESRRRWRLQGLFTKVGGRLLTTESTFRKWSALMLAKGPQR